MHEDGRFGQQTADSFASVEAAAFADSSQNFIISVCNLNIFIENLNQSPVQKADCKGVICLFACGRGWRQNTDLCLKDFQISKFQKNEMQDRLPVL